MAALGKILVTVFFVGIILWVSVLNRTEIDISLIPVLATPVPVSAAMIILLSAMIGFLWGGLIVWLNGSVDRSEMRRLRREVKIMEQETAQKDK